jgi:ABC-type transporter Mla maintaining outer membrane lipid asymmetry ATPase subunit MlaF
VGDRFAFLDGGRLRAEGTADELSESENPLVRDFMKSQQAG